MAHSALTSFALLVAAGFAGCAATAHSQEPASPAQSPAHAPAMFGAMSYADARSADHLSSGDKTEIMNYSGTRLPSPSVPMTP